MARVSQEIAGRRVQPGRYLSRRAKFCPSKPALTKREVLVFDEAKAKFKSLGKYGIVAAVVAVVVLGVLLYAGVDVVSPFVE
jgi:negative regulator of sigma E activity